MRQNLIAKVSMMGDEIKRSHNELSILLAQHAREMSEYTHTFDFMQKLFKIQQKQGNNHIQYDILF